MRKEERETKKKLGLNTSKPRKNIKMEIAEDLVIN